MSQIITSRRSFLTGFGALIAAPAIVRATNIMPVKQMLILPDRLEDVTFPIEGYGGSSFQGRVSFKNGTWIAMEDFKPVDISDRWERMKRRELIWRNNEWDGKPIT